MQDGAPLHCTDIAKSLLTEKFRGRIISRGSELIWLAHNQDLDPFDFDFWAAAQRQANMQKPESIQEPVECVW